MTPDGPRESLRSYLPHLGVIVGACAGFAALDALDFMTGRRYLLHPALLLLLLAVLWPVRARDVAAPLRIVHRTIVGLFTVYALAAYPAVDAAWLARHPLAEALVLHGRWVALAGGILAWWRPGFGLLPILFISWKKHRLGDAFGFRLNATDYYVVAELGLFVCFAIGLAALVQRFQRAPRPTAWSIGESVFVAALALHLANYFWSAIAKMTLPGALPWTWLLENETHNIMMATATIGLGPLQGYDTSSALGLRTLAFLEPAMNAFTLFSQLAAFAGVLRMRWAVALTLLYDVMHLGIFFTTGILFWKWMTLNAGLIVALSALKNRAMPRPVVAIGAAMLLLSPGLFTIAHLGWYDAPVLNRPRFEAILEDGRAVAVPTNYFLEGSAEIAKSSFAKPFQGHFEPVQAFGKVKHLDELRAAERCALPVAAESRLARSFEDPRHARYIRQHHRFILAHATADGHFPYNWFPHHNWSNPRRFADFAAVDLRKIVAYRYIVESICFRHDGAGGIAEDVKLRGTHDIDVR